MSKPDSESLQDFFTACKARVETVLHRQLQSSAAPADLLAAMQYASLKGGKRIRPVLAYGSALAVGGDMVHADQVACALELMHCYSLVHDDLPAMDNDDLRRGIPTLHKAFDETTAILAGDALQTLAFQTLTDTQAGVDAVTVLRMVRTLATAAGFEGMAAGQALDFEATGKLLTQTELETMHALKTGALIRASTVLGGLSFARVTEPQLQALASFGTLVGLAFQVQDDILDVTADTATLGKPQGADQLLNKPTYISLLGLDRARALAQDLSIRAVVALESLPASAGLLRQLAHYIVQRTH